jgi:hypothetical protein
VTWAKHGESILEKMATDEPSMSALGQKQTFCDATAMSALPPKAASVSLDYAAAASTIGIGEEIV